MVEIVEKVDCPGCGAPLKIAAGEIVVTCEYCGTAVNLKAEKPFVLSHSIIPNNYTQQEIEEKVKAWMQSGFAMPATLARKARFKKTRLVFLPFYSITAHAVTDYKGVFTRTGQPKDVEDTITREYQWTVLARRSVAFPEREYTIPLSGKASFDLSMIEGEFLNAEMDEDEAREKAHADIEANQDYLAKENVDQITERTTDIDIKDAEFLHAPVWFVEYQYGGRVYHVLVDGSTGEVITGDIPVEQSTFPLIWVLAVICIALGALLFLLL